MGLPWSSLSAPRHTVGKGNARTSTKEGTFDSLDPLESPVHLESFVITEGSILPVSISTERREIPSYYLLHPTLDPSRVLDGSPSGDPVEFP